MTPCTTPESLVHRQNDIFLLIHLFCFFLSATGSSHSFKVVGATVGIRCIVLLVLLLFLELPERNREDAKKVENKSFNLHAMLFPWQVNIYDTVHLSR